jgi:hypothetical protein
MNPALRAGSFSRGKHKSRLLNAGTISIATGASLIQPEPGLLGENVVVIGGSASYQIEGGNHVNQMERSDESIEGQE